MPWGEKIRHKTFIYCDDDLIITKDNFTSQINEHFKTITKVSVVISSVVSRDRKVTHARAQNSCNRTK